MGSAPLEGRQAEGALHPIAARVPVLGQGQPQPGSPCSPVRLPLACGQSVNFRLLFVGFWSHFGAGIAVLPSAAGFAGARAWVVTSP